jgi:calcineurin-like phosphoesterase
MRLLFIADIVGQPGRRAVEHFIPQLRKREKLDVVIANGENSAGGSGITKRTADEIFAAGVDVITSGDHLWDQKEVSSCSKRSNASCDRSIIRRGRQGRGVH